LPVVDGLLADEIRAAAEVIIGVDENELDDVGLS
jgi:hypothetical protein